MWDDGMLTVGVPTYNSAGVLGECLRSVAQELPHARVAVSDNGSSDETLEIAAAHNVTVLRGPNRGFGAACNRVACQAGTQYCLFLNPDTVLTKCDRTLLTSELVSTRFAIGSPLVREAKSGPYRHLVFEYPSIRHEASLVTYGMLRPRGLPHQRHKVARRLENAWVSGAAMFIDTTSFLEVGGFDEQFFLYYEDCDLSRRVLEKGGRIALFDGLKVAHMGGQGSATRGTEEFMITVNLLSWLRYVALEHGKPRATREARRVVSALSRISRLGTLGEWSGRLRTKGSIAHGVLQRLESTVGQAGLPVDGQCLYPDVADLLEDAVGAGVSHE